MSLASLRIILESSDMTINVFFFMKGLWNKNFNKMHFVTTFLAGICPLVSCGVWTMKFLICVHNLHILKYCLRYLPLNDIICVWCNRSCFVVLSAFLDPIAAGCNKRQNLFKSFQNIFQKLSNLQNDYRTSSYSFRPWIFSSLE